MNSIYEVRVSKWLHAFSVFFISVPVLTGAVMLWAYAARDRASLDTLDNDLLAITALTGFSLLLVFLLEYYIYRVRLFVITPRYEYAFRPFIGNMRYFNAQEIGSMDVGGPLLRTLILGQVLTLYDHENRVICRLDFSMRNVLRFRDELYTVLSERNVNNYMTGEIRAANMTDSPADSGGIADIFKL